MGHIEDAGFLLSKMMREKSLNIEHDQIRNPAEIKTWGFVLHFYSFSRVDYVLRSRLNGKGKEKEERHADEEAAGLHHVLGRN